MTTPPEKSNRTRNIILLIAGIGACVWLGQFAYHAMHYVDTDDAFVAGHVHQVSAQVGGPVKSVYIRDNQAVKAGDPLVQIDPLEFEIIGQRARAGLAEAQARAAEQKANAIEATAKYTVAQARIAQAEAQANQVRSQFDLAKITRDRDQKLLGAGSDAAVTQADWDNAKSAYEAAEAASAGASANLQAVQASLLSAGAERDAAQAQAKAAEAEVGTSEAAVRDADRQLSYCKISAPVTGTIGAKSVEAGDRVEAGQALLSLVEPDVWIVANFKETQLALMKVGQPVSVTIDALPGVDIRGSIESVAPASGAQFALLPADNATGNFTKVVQRVAVKIILDTASAGEAAGRLRPGLSAVVNVRVK